MSRLDIKTPSRAQTVVEGLYRDVERRIAASPPGLCPVEMSLSFLQLCHAQTCGKCVPCRIGLGQLTKLISQVLDGTANMGTVRIIEKTARSILRLRLSSKRHWYEPEQQDERQRQTHDSPIPFHFHFSPLFDTYSTPDMLEAAETRLYPPCGAYTP